MRSLVLALLICALVATVGCGAIAVTIEKPDGTVVHGAGVSLFKDHGLEGFAYKRKDTGSCGSFINREQTSSEASIGVEGYRSQSRIDAVLKLIDELK